MRKLIRFLQKQFTKKYLGGSDSSVQVAEILEFDPLIGEWTLLDEMLQGRSYHAVSVLNFEPGLCQEKGKQTHFKLHCFFMMQN